MKNEKISHNIFFRKIFLYATLVITFFLASTKDIIAHVDTSITLSEKGLLTDLPEEFQPASFDIERKELRISGKLVAFEDAILEMFPDYQHRGSDNLPPIINENTDEKSIPYNLKFSASWYHGPSLTPPYLIIKIIPESADFIFKINVDMENCKVTEGFVIIKPSGFKSISIPVVSNSKLTASHQLKEWKSAIGKWRAGDVLTEITNDSITSRIDNNDQQKYPSGLIESIEPGKVKIKTSDGKEKILTYEMNADDDILVLYLDIDPLELVRVGSEAEKKWNKRVKSVR